MRKSPPEWDWEASAQLSQAQGAQYTKIAALLQTLGGGWDQEADEGK